ncbi:ScbR family autoregulator-binding transcription factor [Streptacidiphilus pinicola]|nr:ScbR family autoregulator-binding transcription factor [Streptacidiphilus pinicola]
MKQQRAVRTRESLVRAAAEAFDEQGYDQAKLADISAGAGVTRGALTFHFASKSAMALTVETTAAVTLRRVALAAQKPSMNAMQRLLDISLALAGEIRDNVVARAGFRLNCETPQRAGLDLRREWFACIRRLLAQAEAEGLLTPGLDPQDAALSIAAATTGLEVLGRRQPGWLSPAVVDRFWRFALPQITAEESRPGLGPDLVCPCR